MYEQIERSKENKSKAVANSVSQYKSNVKQCFGFVDHRPEAVGQRKLQTTTFDPPSINLKSEDTHTFVLQKVPAIQLQVDLKQARAIYSYLNEKFPNVPDFARFSYFQNLVNGVEMTYESAINLIDSVQIERGEESREERIPLTRSKFMGSSLDVVGEREKTRRVATLLEGTWKLTGNQANENPTPNEGYSFVTMEDGTIRVWPIIHRNGTFHRGLADFSNEIRFAGEVIFDDKGNVKAWYNKSGNYQPKCEYAEYAGLPMDKFEKHVGKGPGGKESRHLQKI